MFCVKCGNELKDDMKFCNKCGEKVGEYNSNVKKEEIKEEIKEEEIETVQTEVKATNEYTSGRNNLTTVETIITIIVCIVIFYFGFMGFSYLVNGEFYIPTILKVILIGCGIFYVLKEIAIRFIQTENNNISNSLNNKNEIKKLIIAIIIIGLISFGINNWMQGMNGEKQKEQDKKEMLSTIQKYSWDTITVNDFKLELVEKSNVYTIYKVRVNKSDYLIDGEFYVALSKPNGDYTKYVLLSKDLNELKEDL